MGASEREPKGFSCFPHLYLLSVCLALPLRLLPQMGTSATVLTCHSFDSDTNEKKGLISKVCVLYNIFHMDMR